MTSSTATCPGCGWKGPEYKLREVCGRCYGDVVLDEDGYCDNCRLGTVAVKLCPGCDSDEVTIAENAITLPEFLAGCADEAEPITQRAMPSLRFWNEVRGASVLAALRAVLTVHNTAAALRPDAPYVPDDPRCEGCGFNGIEEPMALHVDECPVLRALALIFADQPGYRQEWMPDA